MIDVLLRKKYIRRELMDNILIPFVTMISFIFSLQVKYLDLNLDGLHEPILVAAAPNALNSFLLLLKALRLALALALQDFFFLLQIM